MEIQSRQGTAQCANILKKYRQKLNLGFFILNPWPVLLYILTTPKGQTEVFQFEANIYVLITATYTHTHTPMTWVMTVPLLSKNSSVLLLFSPSSH